MEKEAKKGKCIIVGAGAFYGIPAGFTIDEDRDFLIAADAGYENCRQAGLRPQLLIGDFDSMHIQGVKGETGDVSGLSIFEDAEKAEYLKHLRLMQHEGIETRVIDPVKNDPDLLAAVRIGLEEGFREFHFLGATGKRMDHSIANLQILGFLAKRGCHGYLYGETQIITAIRNEACYFPAGRKGYFSALALTDEAKGVTEEGFKYVVEDVTLNNLTPTGLSNEFVGTEAMVRVTEGTLLLIYESDFAII